MLNPKFNPLIYANSGYLKTKEHNDRETEATKYFNNDKTQLVSRNRLTPGKDSLKNVLSKLTGLFKGNKLETDNTSYMLDQNKFAQALMGNNHSDLNGLFINMDEPRFVSVTEKLTFIEDLASIFPDSESLSNDGFQVLAQILKLFNPDETHLDVKNFAKRLGFLEIKSIDEKINPSNEADARNEKIKSGTVSGLKEKYFIKNENKITKKYFDKNDKLIGVRNKPLKLKIIGVGGQGYVKTWMIGIDGKPTMLKKVSKIDIREKILPIKTNNSDSEDENSVLSIRANFASINNEAVEQGISNYNNYMSTAYEKLENKYSEIAKHTIIDQQFLSTKHPGKINSYIKYVEDASVIDNNNLATINDLSIIHKYNKAYMECGFYGIDLKSNWLKKTDGTLWRIDLAMDGEINAMNNKNELNEFCGGKCEELRQGLSASRNHLKAINTATLEGITKQQLLAAQVWVGEMNLLVSVEDAVKAIKIKKSALKNLYCTKITDTEAQEIYGCSQNELVKFLAAWMMGTTEEDDKIITAFIKNNIKLKPII